MRSLFTLIIIVCCAQAGIAQEIQLLVKKGTAVVSEKVVQPGQIVTLNSDQVIKVQPSSLVMLRKNNAIVELKPGQTYTFKAATQNFKNSKGFTASFSDLIFSQEFSVQDKSASSTRGNNDDPLAFSPADGVRILTDSLSLQAGGDKSTLLSDVLLFGSGLPDTLRFTQSRHDHRLATPATGNYGWQYQAQTGLKPTTVKVSFTVPTAEEKAQLLKQYEAHQSSLKSFSPEMKEILLMEYCLQNKIYVE
jgi:hypothetical protein